MDKNTFVFGIILNLEFVLKTFLTSNCAIHPRRYTYVVNAEISWYQQFTIDYTIYIYLNCTPRAILYTTLHFFLICTIATVKYVNRIKTCCVLIKFLLPYYLNKNCIAMEWLHECVNNTRCLLYTRAVTMCYRSREHIFRQIT